jgi:hypothetical protein
VPNTVLGSIEIAKVARCRSQLLSPNSFRGSPAFQGSVRMRGKRNIFPLFDVL